MDGLLEGAQLTPQNQEKERKTKTGTQTKGSDMNPTVGVSTWNINGPHAPVEGRWSEGIRKQDHLSARNHVDRKITGMKDKMIKIKKYRSKVSGEKHTM